MLIPHGYRCIASFSVCPQADCSSNSLYPKPNAFSVDVHAEPGLITKPPTSVRPY